MGLGGMELNTWGTRIPGGMDITLISSLAYMDIMMLIGQGIHMIIFHAVDPFPNQHHNIHVGQ